MVVILDILYCCMLLVNVYMSPPFQVQLLYHMLTWLAQFVHLSLYVLLDFNAILDAALDSYNPDRASSADLHGWASVAGLLELWRWKHPSDRCFSHTSLAHGSSQTELTWHSVMIYCGENLIFGGGLSNHNPLSLSHPGRLGWGVRGNGVYHPVGCSTSRFWTSNVDMAEPLVVWDAFKAVARGNTYLPSRPLAPMIMRNLPVYNKRRGSV